MALLGPLPTTTTKVFVSFHFLTECKTKLIIIRPTLSLLKIVSDVYILIFHHSIMKKVEAIVKSDRLSQVIMEMRKAGAGGLTVIQSRGQGAEEPPLVGDFHSGDTVFAVVDDSKVEPLISAISDVACTGEKGDGKVFVTNVEEALDICTKKRGSKAI
ncbi:MAG: hypothetical protein YK1309IOTA_1700002 [Marine Group I thaumarchaeote]|nr:MAG: hypothetical protein YK1309IOTA_1700002 [Marine Group I thaumarchaeote]